MLHIILDVLKQVLISHQKIIIVLKIKLCVDNNPLLNAFIVEFKHLILSSCSSGFYFNLSAIQIRIIHLLFVNSSHTKKEKACKLITNFVTNLILKKIKNKSSDQCCTFLKQTIRMTSFVSKFLIEMLKQMNTRDSQECNSSYKSLVPSFHKQSHYTYRLDVKETFHTDTYRLFGQKPTTILVTHTIPKISLLRLRFFIILFFSW